jgi:TonB-linked SusC/RagA family outer membrane protein
MTLFFSPMRIDADNIFAAAAAGLLAVLLPAVAGGPALAQDAALTGAVVDEAGEPLAGAQVRVVGDGGGDDGGATARTDAEGRFALQNADRTQRLRVTWEGRKQKTVPARAFAGEDPVVIGKASDLIPLGHGREVRRAELTVAVDVIDGDELDDLSSVRDPMNALYGRLAGLWVQQNTGPPGQREATLTVRGPSTLNDESPLVLVDGFEGSLVSLSLEEIERVVLMKGVGATARYGQRGANGVLLVTTKEGRSGGQPTYDLSAEYGAMTPTRMPSFLDAPAYAQAVNQARASDGRDARYSETDIERYRSGAFGDFYPNVDWVDQVTRNRGGQAKVNFHARGGDETAAYFVNLGYQRESGFYSDEFADAPRNFSTQLRGDKINLRIAGDLNITNSTLAKINLATSIQSRDEPRQGNVLGPAYATPSAAIPVRYRGGAFGGSTVFRSNPAAQLALGGNRTVTQRYVNLTGQISQGLDKWIPGLDATLRAGYDNAASFVGGNEQGYVLEQASLDFVNDVVVDTNVTTFGEASPLEPYRYSGGLHRSQFDFEGRLNYDATVGSDDLNASLLYHQQGETRGVGNQTFRWQKFAGDVRYGIDDTYFLNAVASFQGSNRIQTQGDRWGFFPAVSAAWLLSNEGFLSGSGALDELKLRASAGKAGNGRVPITNITSPRYSGTGSAGRFYRFGSNASLFFGTGQDPLPAPTKTFESSYEADVGLDLEAWDRLSASAEAFYARRTDILVGSNGSISDVLGLSVRQRADGVVENRGVELDIGWEDEMEDVTYSLGGQVAYAQNTVIDQNEAPRPFDYLEREREAVSQRFGLETDGFFDSDQEIQDAPTQQFGDVQPGDIRYVDQNDDGVINRNDRVPVGAPAFPELTYAGRIGAGYKGFHLSALFQGMGRRSVYLSRSDVYWPLRGQSGNISTWYDNYWTPDNKDGAELPRLTTEENQNNFQVNDLWVRSGAFVKLRFAELSYTLDEEFASSLGVGETAIYLRGRNLFSLDGIDYADPENVNTTYPSTRSYVLGVNLRF